MANKRRPPKRHRKIQPDVPVPADEELFGIPMDEPLVPKAIHDGDDVFAPLIGFTAEPEFTDPAVDTLPAPGGGRSSHVSALRRWSVLQVLIVAGIVAVAGILVHNVVPKAHPRAKTPSAHAPAETTPQRPQASLTYPSPKPPAEPPAPIETVEPSQPDLHPLSLQVAEKFYRAHDFVGALATYDALYRRLPVTEENQALRDFLLLRTARCNRSVGNIREADKLFRTVSLSRLPVLRALARYHQSTALLARGRHLEAATRAYQTLALIEVVDYDPKWLGAVKQECEFLVAEAMTRNLLSLRDADADLPERLWAEHPDIDPFANLEEPQLRVLLHSGALKLDEALLGPQIRSAAERGTAGRWTVICNGASVEELLARFASNAGLDVQWRDQKRTASEQANMRRHPVYLCLKSATPQQVVKAAAGSVGLLARLDSGGTVHVQDPSAYTSLAEHTRLLADESLSLWQRFLFTAEENQRGPNAHFAMALVHAVRDRFGEAVAEYKLVANRYSTNALAPHALLYSGRLKAQLRDYVGAHEDLKQLVELYPDSELSDRACLDLADATMNAGLYDEATDLYRKVFHLGLSVESQTESAFGAGRCFYETEEYGAAARWLNRYVSLSRDQSHSQFHAACLLLGKTHLKLDQPAQAHAALNLALKGELTREQHVETIATLVQACLKQGLYIEALDLLEGTQAWQLSQQESVELRLLRARLLRTIGLLDKAVAVLADQIPFLPNPELKLRVALELGRCYSAQGRDDLARETLSQPFTLVEPGPLALELGAALSEVSLRLGRSQQAASVCDQLLAYAEPGVHRDRLLKLQAEAYRQQERYDRAILAVIEQSNERTSLASTAPGATPSGVGP